ncbi:PEPxxWA-CTERM sorting domain-containing protein [Novosphingobium sp. Gsoil 351]|nr:PEPxxWA-CTERM sorting domain-containing protein [Novosphingobium sp. Gsoil 351]
MGLAVLGLSTPSAAAVQLVSGGKLTGANGVDVGGALYDVTFAEGTCAGVFGGCNELSDITFTSLTAANAASQALLDQVFLDSDLGQFDSDFSRTFGCAANSDGFCFVIVPYEVFDDASFSGAGAVNYNSLADSVGSIGASSAFNTANANANNSVFARFRSSSLAAVPEPATWAMMLLGFGMIGFGMRRRMTANTQVRFSNI